MSYLAGIYASRISKGPYEAAQAANELVASTGNPQGVGSPEPQLLFINGRTYTQYKSYPGAIGTAPYATVYKTAGAYPFTTANDGSAGYAAFAIARSVPSNPFASSSGSSSFVPVYGNPKFLSTDAGNGKKYWFFLYEEQETTYREAIVQSYSPSVSSPKVWQPFSFDASGTALVYEEGGTGANVTGKGTRSVSFSSLSDLKSKLPGLELSGTLSEGLNRKTQPGSYSMNGNKINGPVQAAFEYSGLSLSVSVQGFSASDTTYFIEKRAGKKPTAYPGITIGQEFADCFRLVRKERNEYMTEGEAVLTVIEEPISATGFSKRTFSEGDQGFSYSGAASAYYAFQTNDLIPFSSMVLSLPRQYYIGNQFGSEGEDPYSGNVIYNDGSWHPLTEIARGEGTAYLRCSREPSGPWLDGPVFSNDDVGQWYGQATFPFPWFGTGSTFSQSYSLQVSVGISPDISSAELVGAPSYFTKGESLTLPSGAKILLKAADGSTVLELTSENMADFVTSWPSGYGNPIAGNDSEDPITAYFSISGVQAPWTYYVGWTESALLLTPPSKFTYYMATAGVPSLDLSGMVVKRRWHTRQSGAWKTLEETLEASEYSVAPPGFAALDKAIAAKKQAVVSWTDGSQSATASFTIQAYLLSPISVEISGTLTDDESKYWDNGLDKWVFPSSLTFGLRYNDGSLSEVANPASSLNFATGSDRSVVLSAGVTPMLPSNGTAVFAIDPASGASGFYYIEFMRDEPTSLSVTPGSDKPTMVLGNRLSSIASSLSLTATWKSGLRDPAPYDDWSFASTARVMSVPETIEIVDDMTGKTYEIPGTAVSWQVPQASLSISLNGARTSYLNGTDSIDLSSATGKVTYSGTDYEESVSVSFDGSLDEAGEMVPAVPEGNPLYGKALDGSAVVSVDMGSDVEKQCPVPFEALNAFDASQKATGSVSITVYEISDVTGLSLIKARTTYEVGDAFLGEGDDETTVRVFFQDAEGARRSVAVPLSSGLVSLNVYPFPGTELTSPTEGRTVTVRAANNSSIMVEYSIRVLSRILPTGTTTHSIVAVKADEYACPDGTVINGKYVLINEAHGEGDDYQNNTVIDAETGNRILAPGKSLTSYGVEVFGYLDDVGDPDKGAKVILFDDWLPPIDGQANATVRFPCYAEGNSDLIDGCSFGILFGNNNARNRLFVSGNPSKGNCDWHSGNVVSDMVEDPTDAEGNFAYFEDDSWCYYGETDNSVVGYDIVANSRLLVLKSKSDKETSVYFRTAGFAAAIGSAGEQLTGIDGSALYQEAFPLEMGNNTAAGVSPKAVANLNGDSLFVSSDGSVMGLDVEGIVGDAQRYATTRSRWIDAAIAKEDPSTARLWADGKALVLSYPDCCYLTDCETLYEGQYEWWKVSVRNSTAFLAWGDERYIGTSDGYLRLVSDGYEDADAELLAPGSAFVTYGGTAMGLSASAMADLPEGDALTFEQEDGDLLCRVGAISNSPNSGAPFIVRTSEGCLMLSPSAPRETANLLWGDGTYYLLQAAGDGTLLNDEYRPWKMEPSVPIDGNPCWKLVGEDGAEADYHSLFSAILARLVDFPCEVSSIDREAQEIELSFGGNPIVYEERTKPSSGGYSFSALITSRRPVSARLMSKPFDFGSLDSFKTIWQWTVSGDGKEGGELEVALVTNKGPRLPALVTREALGLDFSKVDFRSVDLDLDKVTRTYSSNRVVPRLRFACIGFKSEGASPSSVSAVSIVYSVPMQAYGGD